MQAIVAEIAVQDRILEFLDAVGILLSSCSEIRTDRQTESDRRYNQSWSRDFIVESQTVFVAVRHSTHC